MARDAGCAIGMLLIIVLAWSIYIPQIWIVVGVFVVWFLLSELWGGNKKKPAPNHAEGNSASGTVDAPVANDTPSQRKPAPIRFHIKGMLKTYGDDVANFVRGGEFLALQRESGNRYDSNAILVLSEAGAKLGYVERGVAAQLAPKMDAGKEFFVRVMDGSYSEWSYGMCSVELLSEDEVQALKKRMMGVCTRCGISFDASSAEEGELLRCPSCHMALTFGKSPEAHVEPHYFFDRSQDADAIATFAKKRHISRLVHFTSLRSLEGVFKMGQLMSRQAMHEYRMAHPEDESCRSFHANDAGRWDGRLDLINTSIERANTKLLWVMSHRAENEGRGPWVILELDPVCLEKKGVLFTTSNAASTYVRHYGTRAGLAGLEAMFSATITSGRQLDGHLTEKYLVTRGDNTPFNCPTDIQAEVLIPDTIGIDLVKGIICRTDYDYQQVQNFIKSLGVDGNGFRLQIDEGAFDDMFRQGIGRRREW